MSQILHFPKVRDHSKIMWRQVTLVPLILSSPSPHQVSIYTFWSTENSIVLTIGTTFFQERPNMFYFGGDNLADTIRQSTGIYFWICSSWNRTPLSWILKEIVAFVERGFDKARVYVKHGVFHNSRETEEHVRRYIYIYIYILTKPNSLTKDNYAIFQV